MPTNTGSTVCSVNGISGITLYVFVYSLDNII